MVLAQGRRSRKHPPSSTKHLCLDPPSLKNHPPSSTKHSFSSNLESVLKCIANSARHGGLAPHRVSTGSLIRDGPDGKGGIKRHYVPSDMVGVKGN
eukprot:scaffold163690_cov17-Tisochrysis_lutea.AAC.1